MQFRSCLWRKSSQWCGFNYHKKGSGTKPTITFNTNAGYATLAMDEPLYDGPGFVRWRQMY
jgi:hypothetical protein